MDAKLTESLLPNRFRGHAVMLSSFITGQIYFILLIAGFSAALGLTAGIVTAPIGFMTGAATLYIVRRAVNLEFKALGEEAKYQDIELENLPEMDSSDLFEISKELYLDRKSWIAVIVSLAKFPIGLASLVFITAYLALSITLMSTPLIYRSVDLQFYGNMINTPLEISLSVLAGAVIYLIGVNATEKASIIYLKLNSHIN